jgi:hypothetical protein
MNSNAIYWNIIFANRTEITKHVVLNKMWKRLHDPWIQTPAKRNNTEPAAWLHTPTKRRLR